MVVNAISAAIKPAAGLDWKNIIPTISNNLTQFRTALIGVHLIYAFFKYYRLPTLFPQWGLLLGWCHVWKKNGTLCTHNFWVYLWRMHTGCSKTEGYTYMETKFETKFITLCNSYINRSVIDHLCQFRQCDLLSKWQWRPRKGFIIVGEDGARWATFCSNTNIFKINGHTQLKFCICIACEVSSKVSKSNCTHHAHVQNYF